ncbi:MAG TPA: BCCT family transporter [Clostridia bacterium]|nr:BCCT family transporter [Clostridia bacterium]
MLKTNESNTLKRNTLDLKIFLPSLIILFIFCIPFVKSESSSLDALNGLFDIIVNNFGWMYLWYPIILIGFGVYFMFSRYGKIVLGDPAEKSQFTFFEYASIIVAMALGSSIMRTGMIQWIGVAMAPPFGLEPLSNEALMWGNPYGMFLWSFQTFSIYALSAPAIGYLLFVRKAPVFRISEVCRCIFGDKFTDGIGGKILDILFLVSIIAGSAVFLGLGTPIITNILTRMFNIQMSFGLTVTVCIVWVICFTISAYLGIEKGIKNLSTFNMYLAAVVGLFIILAGPGVFILNQFTDSVGFLLKNYIDISFYSNSLNLTAADSTQRYTVFWFAYVATWGLVQCAFIAKVSKGRTIKEMLATIFLAPMLLSWVITGILGGLSMHRYLTGAVNVIDIVKNGGGVMAVIPQVLETLPLPLLIMAAFLITTMIFLITTLDSTTYTIAAYSSTEDMSKNEPAKNLRLLTAGVISGIALLLLKIGGLGPLEVVSGLMGLPIIFVQFATIYAFIKMANQDKAWENNIRK